MKYNELKSILAGCAIISTALMTVGCSKIIRVTTSDDNLTKRVVIDRGFHGIQTMSTADIEYTQSDSVSVTVNAPEAVINEISVDIKDGILIVSEKDREKPSVGNRNVINKFNITVKISAPDVNYFSSLGTGDITAQSLKGDSLSFSTRGTGDIEIANIEAHYVNAVTDGTGDIEIKKLRCDKAELYTRGTGDIEVNDIKTTDVISSTKGTGDISFKKGSIKSAVLFKSGTGDLEYKGVKIERLETN